MIPIKLKNLIEKQAGDVRRTNRVAAEHALCELGVPLDSEFAEFYLNYKITLFQSDASDEQLCDVTEPSAEVAQGTQFVHKVWGLPEQYVCFSSIQGEGAYLYDRNTGKVWNFSLASRDAFLAGKEQSGWHCFYDFLVWYLGEAE
jgi:hypothetical protein